jgi:tRNA U55 pseudouridine synthase TruB
MHSAVHIDGKRLYEYAREGAPWTGPRASAMFQLDVLRLEGRP